MAKAPDKNQYALDFESSFRERDLWLRAALRRFRGVDLTHYQLVHYFHTVGQGASAEVSRTHDELAERMFTSSATIRRKLQWLIDRGFLSRDEQRYCRGGQQANVYAVEWDRVRELAVGRSAIPHVAGAQNEQAGAHFDYPGAQIEHPIKEEKANGKLSVKPPPPPSSTKEASGGESRRPPAVREEEVSCDGWEAEERELRALGVAKAREAVQHVRSQGLPASFIKTCREIAKAREGGFRSLAGCLYSRLMLAAPTQDAGACWPKADERKARQARERVSLAKSREVSRDREAKRLAGEREQAELRERHERAKGALAAIGDAEIVARLTDGARLLFRTRGREAISLTSEFERIAGELAEVIG